MSAYTFCPIEIIIDGNGAEFMILKQNGFPCTFYEVLQLMLGQPLVWHQLFADFLKSTEVDGVFWEWPKLKPENLIKPDVFKSIIIGTTLFNQRSANPCAFGLQSTEKVVAIWNPTHTTRLVIPDLGCHKQLGHLLGFMETLQVDQIQDVDIIQKYWSKCASVIIEEVAHNGVKGTWVSTSGLAVPWLHLRVSSEPKYYNYDPYTL